MTVGPNIGWSPITCAFDPSIAATGAILSEVKSQSELVFMHERGNLADDPDRIPDRDRDDDEVAGAPQICAFVSAVERPETRTS